LQFHPQLAAILNVEPDHLDCYRDLDDIVEAFAAFARNVAADGLLVCNADDLHSVVAAARSRAEVETFGLCASADWRADRLSCDQGRYRFDVSYRGRRLFSTGLAIPGLYNVSNALAAIALAYRAGAGAQELAAALPRFHGVDRRLTLRGAGQGVTILDDYAHHPTEIRVTIEAARARYEPKRMWVVFQPHQHARTKHFMSEFAQSFDQVEEIIVPDVYGAREKGACEGADSAELVQRICSNGKRARYVPRLDAVASYLAPQVAEGDVIMTMGAGDVWKVADELVERFCGSDRVRCTSGPADVVSAGGNRAVSVPAA
jgi:UDP-N-acetylmuramate--alanine ligase